MQSLPTWQAVADYVKNELGATDFYSLLRETKNADKDKFWDRMLAEGMPDAATTRKLEGTTEENRRRYIAGQLAGWRKEQTRPRLLAAAVCIRVALAAAPEPEEKIVRVYQPFEEGNTAGLTHGTRAAAFLAKELPAEAAAVRDRYQLYPVEDDPPGSELLYEALCRGFALTDRQIAHLERVGPLDARGEPRKAMADWRSNMKTMGDALHALGRTQRAQAKIIADRAQGARDAVQARKEAIAAEVNIRQKYIKHEDADAG